MATRGRRNERKPDMQLEPNLNGYELRAGINGSGETIFILFAANGFMHRFTTEAEARHFARWA
jgi:hypothetical protein